MDAFNDILTVEHEVELTIDTAKKEAVAAVADARVNHKLRLEEEELKLQDAERASLASHKVHVSGLVEKIQSEVQAKIVVLEKRFATHKADLKSTVTKSF